ncbi:MAG: GAF domain-containing protein [Aeromicrobium sp.]
MPHRARAPASTVGPGLDFEGALGELVDRADQMMRSHARLRELVRVNNDLTSNLDLETLLRKIAEIGTDLIQAEYGAIGVIGEDGGMAQFITVGMDAHTVALVGPTPEGKGLLGALIDDPTPVRLSDLADDPRSSGFPAHHPPMTSFLGVPIRVRGEVFGNLYLTDSHNGTFSADDEELAQALAATAGIAIANARLFEDALYREKWASALAETARRLMQDEDDEHLGFLVDRVKELADADLVSIGLVPGPCDDMVIERAAGIGAEGLIGTSSPLETTVAGEAIRSARPVLVPDLRSRDHHGFGDQGELGNAMVVPFVVGDSEAGVLSLARLSGRPAFGAHDLDMAESFASHISVSIDRAAARTVRRRVALLEDRSRIARDLHDHVIQRLFATALSLQAVAVDLAPAPARGVTDQIREIDASIAQIRQSIFALHSDATTTRVGLRARVLEIVDRGESQDPGEPRPRVTFLGPVDLMAGAALTDDVAAVVTEGLANVLRHARATSIEVLVSAAAGRVTVEVSDDGVGPGTSARHSGLANLRARAEHHHGTFELLARPSGGSQMLWSVPA